MILTEAFLAAKAAFVDGRLNVEGGLLGTMYVPRQLATGDSNVATGNLYLVTLVRTGPQDHQKPHPLTIDYVDATGHREVLAEDSIVFDNPAEGGGCWISPITIAAPKPGVIVFNVSIEGGGKPVSIPVQVLIAQ